MESSTYSVRLKTWLRRNGKTWIAWCRAIDVMSQARTRQSALEAVREAVELWFESCIEREVLDGALREFGFVELSDGETSASGLEDIIVRSRRTPPSDAMPSGLAFTLGNGDHGDSVEGLIPAHLVADQLGTASRAAA